MKLPRGKAKDQILAYIIRTPLSDFKSFVQPKVVKIRQDNRNRMTTSHHIANRGHVREGRLSSLLRAASARRACRGQYCGWSRRTVASQQALPCAVIIRGQFTVRTSDFTHDYFDSRRKTGEYRSHASPPCHHDIWGISTIPFPRYCIPSPAYCTSS